ncbi:MAG: XdhC/CoxI family protein [Candidatus Latescibacterota bacterium]|nr:XdhC/CoxI family protein [Candidatus Latescibacterota bacterium]
MDDIIREIGRRRQRGERMALASLVWSSGSIPMSDRAKMIVGEDGGIFGTIGGGCLEAEVLTAGRTALETGDNQLMRYTMTEKQAGESGLNCGGTVRIYTELIAPNSSSDLYGAVLEARAARQGCILATLLKGRNDLGVGKLWIGADGATRGSLGAAAVDRQVAERLPAVLKRERGQVFELDLDRATVDLLGEVSGEFAGKPEVFIEPFLPEPVLYVFGGGHVGGHIGVLAKNVGFRVVIIDDRPAFANPERHPGVDECLVAEMDGVFDQLPIDNQAYIVIATRGHQHDEIVVEAAIKTPARYVGMIGSERKKMMLWRRIESRGGDREQLGRVYAPIGANIGADTPEEIAISVVAELISIRRGKYKVWKTKKGGVDGR